MKKAIFIYNPMSGDANIDVFLDDIIQAYQRYDNIIIPYRIPEDFEMDNFLKSIDFDIEHILIAGGDGTVNRVINAMEKQKMDIPIAILPTGTANDFAKLIGIPTNLQEACEKILNGDVHEVDLGCINGSYFINIFSFGFFTDVSQKTPTQMKNALGKLAYYLNTLKEIPTLKKINISIKSKEMEYEGDAIIVLVFNGRTAGNIKVAYKSSINDGLLDVIVVKDNNIKRTLELIYKFIKHEHLDIKNDSMLFFQTSDLKIDVKGDIPTDVDGEKGPNFPVNISCEHLKIKMLF